MGQQSKQKGLLEDQPVTLAEAKAHLRVFHDDDDDYIGALIPVCTQFVETVTGRTLIRREFEVRTSFPQGAGLAAMIAFHLVPVDSVEAVEYVAPDGQTVTLDPSAYKVETGERALIYPADGTAWPQTDRNAFKPVTITVDAGYAPTGDSPPNPAGNIPKPLKQAILLLIGQMYENREPVVMGSVAAVEIPLAFNALIYPYRVRLGI